VWNQFQWFEWFLFVPGLVSFRIEWGDVMKKLFGSSFLWMRGMNNSRAMNTEEFAASATAVVVKLWRVSMAALLGTILLGFSVPVRGQAVNATLLGTVADSSGAAVSNVKVTITETNTGISRTSQTNESGNYIFPDLPPGTYTVTAEQSGFKRASRAGIDVIVNTTQRVDLVLQPGNVSETVTVEAETPILQTDRADVGEKIELTQLEELPHWRTRSQLPGLARPSSGNRAAPPRPLRILQRPGQPLHRSERPVARVQPVDDRGRE